MDVERRLARLAEMVGLAEERVEGCLAESIERCRRLLDGGGEAACERRHMDGEAA